MISSFLVSDEIILNTIHLIRGRRIMFDFDLANLYEVETKQLKRAVRRNQVRFPDDFMFELSKKEVENLRCQIGTSSWGGSRYPPMAFPEFGVVMLASVLRSKRAIQINIQIVRIFSKMRDLLTSDMDVIKKLEVFKSQLTRHDKQILVIFKYLQQLEEDKKMRESEQNREPIGFKRNH